MCCRRSRYCIKWLSTENYGFRPSSTVSEYVAFHQGSEEQTFFASFMTSGRFYERLKTFKILLSMTTDTVVDGYIICMVRLSTTPGHGMLTIKVEANALFATFGLNPYTKVHDSVLAHPYHLSHLHPLMLLYLNPTGNPYC